MTDPSLFILAEAATGETGNIAVDIMKKFGVHWSLFLSQLISFLIVCFVLKKFAYGPVMEMLDERKNRIKDGEDKLAEIKQRLADSEKETQDLIDKANEDAKRLIEEAKESANILGEKKAQEATAAAQVTLAKAEEAAKAERTQMQKELKAEFGRLVADTTAAVSGKVLNKTDQKRLNEEALSSVAD